MKFYTYFIFSVLCFCFLPLVGKEKAPLQPLNLLQDRESGLVGNPLKGFAQFLFFPMIPAGSKKAADQFMNLVENTLQKYGEVKKSKILLQTENGEVVDLSPFDIGATLVYQIDDLFSPQGRALGIVRASLNFSTAISINRTKESSYPYIWAANCFFRGSTKKHLDRLVEKSLINLLEQFSKDFSLVNSGLPQFDLQGAN